MSMDLIIADSGAVMIASTCAFGDEVVRVDFDLTSRVISLAFANDATPDHVLPLPVSTRLLPSVAQAARVLLVSLEDGQIRAGYDVPLTCIGAV